MLQYLMTEDIRLNHMARCLEERFENGLLNSLVPLRLGREKGRLQRLRKKASFKVEARIEELECSAQRGLKKSSIVPLTQSKWLDDHQNLFISGATGTGKTYLACAIGNQACQLGASVQYSRTSVLLHKLLLLKGRDEYIGYREKLAKVKVLVLDDVGLPGFNAAETAELLECW